MLYTWLSILALGLVTILPECRTRMYMVPAAIIIVYIFFNEYPSAVRRMHRRKLTYEDLEDFRDADPELRQRFQMVFTRVQQLGGALCGGMIVLYGFHVFNSNQSLFEVVGILGGLLSLYARIFGYIGGFCITCLHRLKRKQQHVRTQPERTFENAHPDRPEPEYTKQSDDCH